MVKTECNFFILSLVVNLIAILPHTLAHDDQLSTQCQGSNPKNNTQCQALNPLIEKACANALYKDLCILNLSQLPTKETPDIKSIAFLSINDTKNYGSNVSAWLTEKLKESQLSPDVKLALTKCSEYYSDALEDLKRTIDSFKNAKNFNDRFFNDVNTFVSRAMSSAVHCEDGMKLSQGKGIIMEDKNKGFRQCCSNTLAVTVFWSKNH